MTAVTACNFEIFQNTHVVRITICWPKPLGDVTTSSVLTTTAILSGTGMFFKSSQPSQITTAVASEELQVVAACTGFWSVDSETEIHKREE